MKKRFNELGLVYKITIIIVCILIIPTFLIGAFYYQSYKQSLYDEADKKLEESIYEVNRTIQACLEDANSAINDVEYSQELLYFMDEKSNLSECETEIFLESIQEEWINIRQIYPNLFSYMHLYSANETIKRDGNWKFAFHSLEDFQNLEMAEMYQGIWYGNAYAWEENGANTSLANQEDLIFPAYLNVRNVSSEKLIGIIELSIPFEKVIDSRNLRNLEAGVKYVFSDSTGATIYQSEELWNQRPQVLEEDLLSLVDSVIWNGTVYRILESEIPEIGIMCTVLIEEKLIIQSAQEMIWKFGIVACVGIIFILLLTYLVIKKMLNRLVVLDSAMKQVEKGNFHIQLEEDKYNDEVSRMKKRFQHMADRLQEAIDETISREKAQNEAELRALQAQINPHFLFNTIETMRMQCELDRYYKVGNGLMSLGEIFRYMIRWKGYEVPFYLEWNNLQNYISLMKLRLDDDFSCNMECDEALHNIMVPKMFLQPLVENSFQHGFKGVPAPWELKIGAALEDGNMIIRILDNGCGVSEEKLVQLQQCMQQRKSIAEKEEQYQSIGIVNVLQRMDRICKKGSDIYIGNREQGGVEITVKIVLGER
ncbi:MAG: histidine kinase [Lachnospiraceae bacterium]|nr:histidine kinase [Lachnospiraceae bacterium]